MEKKGVIHESIISTLCFIDREHLTRKKTSLDLKELSSWSIKIIKFLRLDAVIQKLQVIYKFEFYKILNTISIFLKHK